MEFSIRKGFYFLLKFKLKRRAGMALPIFLSPSVQDVAAWLYHHPSGHTDVVLAVGLGMTSRGDQSPADCPMLPSSSYRGRKAGCFSFGSSSSWSPNWKHLGCQEQQRITWFFHVNHETGVVGSTS